MRSRRRQTNCRSNLRQADSTPAFFVGDDMLAGTYDWRWLKNCAQSDPTPGWTDHQTSLCLRWKKTKSVQITWKRDLMRRKRWFQTMAVIDCKQLDPAVMVRIKVPNVLFNHHRAIRQRFRLPFGVLRILVEWLVTCHYPGSLVLTDLDIYMTNNCVANFPKRKKNQTKMEGSFWPVGTGESCVSPLLHWKQAISCCGIKFRSRSQRRPEVQTYREGELAKRCLWRSLWHHRRSICSRAEPRFHRSTRSRCLDFLQFWQLVPFFHLWNHINPRWTQLSVRLWRSTSKCGRSEGNYGPLETAVQRSWSQRRNQSTLLTFVLQAAGGSDCNLIAALTVRTTGVQVSWKRA